MISKARLEKFYRNLSRRTIEEYVKEFKTENEFFKKEKNMNTSGFKTAWWKDHGGQVRGKFGGGGNRYGGGDSLGTAGAPKDYEYSTTSDTV